MCKLDGQSAPTCQFSAQNLERCGQDTVYGEIIQIIKAVISMLAHYVVAGTVKITLVMQRCCSHCFIFMQIAKYIIE